MLKEETRRETRRERVPENGVFTDEADNWCFGEGERNRI